MVKLSALEGKKIRLTSKRGQAFEGVVGDYIYPEGNEPEDIEEIVIDYPIKGDGTRSSDLLGFTAADIASIEVLE